MPRPLRESVLHRDPLGADNAGLRAWVDGPLPVEGIRREMEGTPEVQRVLAIRTMYRDLLGREDDLTGIRYWASSDLTLDQIREAFMNSDEYRARQGVQSCGDGCGRWQPWC